MAGLRVQIEAAATDRSLVGKTQEKRPLKKRDPNLPMLKFWRVFIDHAVTDAKRTRYGLPTHLAIYARWWLEEHHPLQSDKNEWERSFECACGWLGLNAEDERRRLLEDIDTALHQAYMDYARMTVYQMRAAVLACTGQPTAIGKHLALPLVSDDQYDLLAGIDHPEPERVTKQLAQRESKRRPLAV